MDDIFKPVKHAKEDHKVVFFGLSTCGWCRKARTYLDENEISYELCYVDELEGEVRAKALEEVAKHNPRRTFPTIIVDEKEVLIGFNADEYEEKLK
ncbi:MAG: glutaredoxin family protein [Candidatus Geothermincolia bacterium]